MIKLSPRLANLAKMIDDNSNIVDIGCDHGLLDIYLMQTKNNIKIIASDINEKALNNAITNIKRAGLTKKIKTIISDGLESIDTTNLDTIVISGMGAHTITGILYNNLPKLKPINTIILQSNNDLEFLRKKITSIGYYIEDEKIVKEKKYYYTIIKFKKGHKHYNYKELFFGPILLKKKDKIFKDKIELEIKKYAILLSLVPKGHFLYKFKIKRKLYMCREVLKRD